MQNADNNNAVWIGTSNMRNAGPLLAIVPGNFNGLMSGITSRRPRHRHRHRREGASVIAGPAQFQNQPEDANNAEVGVYVQATSVKFL